MNKYKMSAKTLYDLLRYAYKNDMFDDENSKGEVVNMFMKMRKEFESNNVNKNNLTYLIEVEKFGRDGKF